MSRRHGARGSLRRAALVRETLAGLARVRLVARERCGCRGAGACAVCACVAALAYAQHTARRAARIQAAV